MKIIIYNPYTKEWNKFIDSLSCDYKGEQRDYYKQMEEDYYKHCEDCVWKV